MAGCGDAVMVDSEPAAPNRNPPAAPSHALAGRGGGIGLLPAAATAAAEADGLAGTLGGARLIGLVCLV